MNYIFKPKPVIILLLILPGLKCAGKAVSAEFDKAGFYAAMAGKDLAIVNATLLKLDQASIPEKTAYEGALLMKKAGLVKKPREKLGLFKAGRAKLESALKNDETNAEYHFLRLIIQENAPKIVKYRNDLKNDTELVLNSYKKLPPVVQQAIKDYSKNSTVLKPTEL